MKTDTGFINRKFMLIVLPICIVAAGGSGALLLNAKPRRANPAGSSPKTSEFY